MHRLAVVLSVLIPMYDIIHNSDAMLLHRAAAAGTHQAQRPLLLTAFASLHVACCGLSSAGCWLALLGLCTVQQVKNVVLLTCTLGKEMRVRC